jgi:outer membrane murein-binding lipoprotein Lpp
MADDTLPPLPEPAAWAVMAFGRVQKLMVRADVADEMTCAWRETDPEARAVPLYAYAAIAERDAKISDQRTGILGLRFRVEDLEQERDTLRAEVEALRADAEQWRAAVDDYAKGLMQGPDSTGYITRLSLAYHAAIDAARAAGE